MTSAARATAAASAMATAWRAAAAALGIRFESPFGLELLGRVVWCAGWLPDFGCPNGTIIAGRDADDDVFEVAEALGYYTSGLSPYHYERFDRDRFARTLDDWGWFGAPDAAPPWFAGRRALERPS